MTKEQTIYAIIDKHLDRAVEEGSNTLAGKIAEEMRMPGEDQKKERKSWLAIPSKVTDEEIANLETKLSNPLPGDYKTFLKYKHFYELYIFEAQFCKHPIHTWWEELEDMVFDGYPREDLYDKGYIPFATWSDWGMLCFDVNRNDGSNNYPIVLWDHEEPDEVSDRYDNFYDMMVKLDNEDELARNGEE
jgi:hypothetical protein